MSATKEIVPAKVMVQNRAEGLNLISPLQLAVQTLKVTTEEEYKGAEVVLSRIDTALESWEARMEPIIRPIRQGLDGLYALNRDVKTPLETYRKEVAKKMGTFLTQKRIAENEARRKEEEELERLRQEAIAKEAKAQTVKSNSLREKLNQRRAEIEQEIQQKEEAPVERFQGESTGGRVIKTWTVMDIKALMKHILESDRDLTSLVEVNMTQVKALYTLDCANPKLRPESPGEWLPGLDLVETVGVSKRRS